MANDTCPHCEAGDSPRRFKCWECGTPYGVKFALPESYEDSRTRECFRNQLAAVTSERDKHLEIIKACRDGFNNLEPHGKTILDFMNVWLDQSNERAEKAEAERDELRRELAEIREKIQDAEMEAREEPCST